ncbi:RraA family protein [Halostreptopolyspora alba]|uniref:Putative 4-hydroxy-4-methyl-2-oxoglutarate aldolase n=1 Tax=Halostreptopolyspora alba TaxID=2487137 RepID=A0A3N0EG68_9ACTN|nr:RraA family protein [Nocardiopsaceae bacterium YIM 96095]
MGTAALARSGARALGTHLFPVWAGASFAGTALPVRCVPGDNLAIHVAVAQAQRGGVLVVDVAGDPEYGYVDEILAVAARMRGAAGMILDGCVRDVNAIARTGLPVVSAGVCVREAGHDAGGAVGREILMGGDPAPTRVRRGDWVVADDDGVVCLPRGQATSIVAGALEGVSRDQEVLDALSAGGSTLDLLDLDPSRVTGWEGSTTANERQGRGPVSRVN